MTMIWIAVLGVAGVILTLLTAPALEVRLTRRVVNPMLLAAVLLVLAIILQNGAGYTMEAGLLTFLGVVSGILVGLGLLGLTVAAARYALGESPGAGTTSPASEERPGRIV